MSAPEMTLDYFQLAFGDDIRVLQPTDGNHDLVNHRWEMRLVNPVVVGEKIICRYREPKWSDQVFGVCDNSHQLPDGRTSFTIRDATELDVMEAACGKSSSTASS